MSDWGREPGRTAPRRGAGGILLFAVSLLCLAGGVALALGLVPLSQFGLGLSADKDARIAQLERELDRAVNDRVSGGEGDESYAVVVEQRDRLAGDLADLKSQIGQSETASGADSRLRQLRGKLERSEEKVSELTTSLNLAEGVIDDLQAKGNSENQSTSQPADEGSGRIAELEAQLGQRDSMLSQFDAEITSLNTSTDALKTERDELQRERSKLQGELAKAQSHSEQLEQQIALDKETGVNSGSDPAQGGTANRVSQLEEELARREATLTRFDSEIERLNTDNEALKEERNSLQSERSQLQGDLAKAQVQADQLEQEMASLREELANGRASDTSSNAAGDGDQTTPDDSAATGEPASRQPRDPLEVATALGEAKGLGNLSASQRDAVATALIEGECVAEALGENLDRVPVLAMRDMIRLLESDC